MRISGETSRTIFSTYSAKALLLATLGLATMSGRVLGDDPPAKPDGKDAKPADKTDKKDNKDTKKPATKKTKKEYTPHGFRKDGSLILPQTEGLQTIQYNGHDCTIVPGQPTQFVMTNPDGTATVTVSPKNGESDKDTLDRGIKKCERQARINKRKAELQKELDAKKGKDEFDDSELPSDEEIGKQLDKEDADAKAKAEQEAKEKAAKEKAEKDRLEREKHKNDGDDLIEGDASYAPPVTDPVVVYTQTEPAVYFNAPLFPVVETTVYPWVETPWFSVGFGDPYGYFYDDYYFWYHRDCCEDWDHREHRHMTPQHEDRHTRTMQDDAPKTAQADRSTQPVTSRQAVTQPETATTPATAARDETRLADTKTASPAATQTTKNVESPAAKTTEAKKSVRPATKMEQPRRVASVPTPRRRNDR